ncbi:F0F1-ATPase subunit (Ca2+/Mg2+ transporter) [Chitinophaga sp. 180180018-2]|jgi:hypothetical protein|nr:F0F1-ATPase subunit (Ca2+/Mg2+ transporter) [Chitinophaga sp. 212800010-3]
METHEEQTGRRLENRYRPMGELIRGIFFILFGLFAIFAQQMGLAQFRLPPTGMKIVGAVLIIYGLFRVYNGSRKLFFNRN